MGRRMLDLAGSDTQTPGTEQTPGEFTNLTTYLYSEFHFPGLFGLHMNMNMNMSTNIYIFLTTRIITRCRLTTAPHNTG